MTILHRPPDRRHHRRHQHPPRRSAAIGGSAFASQAPVAKAEQSAKPAGWVTVESCTSLVGSVHHEPRSARQSSRRVGRRHGNPRRLQRLRPGSARPGHLHRRRLRQRLQVRRAVLSGTFTANWPVSSGLNPSNGTITVTTSSQGSLHDRRHRHLRRLDRLEPQHRLRRHRHPRHRQQEEPHHQAGLRQHRQPSTSAATEADRPPRHLSGTPERAEARPSHHGRSGLHAVSTGAVDRPGASVGRSLTGWVTCPSELPTAAPIQGAPDATDGETGSACAPPRRPHPAARGRVARRRRASRQPGRPSRARGRRRLPRPARGDPGGRGERGLARGAPSRRWTRCSTRARWSTRRQSSRATWTTAAWSAMWLLAGPRSTAAAVHRRHGAAPTVYIEGSGRGRRSGTPRSSPKSRLAVASSTRRGHAWPYSLPTASRPASRGRDALRRGVPFLCVGIRELVGLVGPFVVPGRTACLRCVDLSRVAPRPVLADAGRLDPGQPGRRAPVARRLSSRPSRATPPRRSSMWASGALPISCDHLVEIPHGFGPGADRRLSASPAVRLRLADRTRDNECMTDLPKKAVVRTARLASLPIGYAGRATLGVGKRLRGTPAEAVAAQVQQRTAEQLFKVLGELKGGAMKFGQALSVFEAALPEGMVAPYRATLTKLQDAAPPMSSTMVHQVLARELGAGWRTPVRELRRRPGGCGLDRPGAPGTLARRSRGRGQDPVPRGRRGADQRPAPDLPGGEAGRGLDPRHRRRPAGRRTAGPGRRGARLLPRGARPSRPSRTRSEATPTSPYPTSSMHTDRVLVSEWLESERSLARLIADGDQADRDLYGERYVRFLFSGPARAGLLHADPHPGNYRLLTDGRLGVVDYGAVARLPGGGLPLVIGTLMRDAVDDDYDAVTGRPARGRLHQAFRQRRCRADPRLPRSVPRAGGDGDVPVLPGVDAGTVQPDQRPAIARLHHDAQDQPAAGVPAHPPGLARRDRRAVPAGGEGAVRPDPRRLPPRLRPNPLTIRSARSA